MNDLNAVMELVQSLLISMQSVKDVSLVGDLVIVLAMLFVYLLSLAWQKKQLGKLEKQIGALKTELESIKSGCR